HVLRAPVEPRRALGASGSLSERLSAQRACAWTRTSRSATAAFGDLYILAVVEATALLSRFVLAPTDCGNAHPCCRGRCLKGRMDGVQAQNSPLTFAKLLPCRLWL